MYVNALSILFALLFLPNIAIDRCNVTLPFDNADDQGQPQPYRLSANVSMSIVSWTSAHVIFYNSNIINLDGSPVPSRALQYLRIPFEVAVEGGRVECMEFNTTDNYWSTLIKRKVLNILWEELDFNSTIYNCLCDANGTSEETSGLQESEVLFCSSHLLNISEFAEAKNWTAEGYVTGVKNQNPCGSCWAFGTVGLLEFQQKKRTGELMAFSEQSLIDCGRKKKSKLGGCFGRTGKDGGTIDLGLAAVLEIGIFSNESYPWIAKDQECYFPPGATLYYKRVYFEPAPVDKNNLLKTLRTTVIAATVYVAEETSVWHEFRGGKILREKCPPRTPPNHAILIVGFGDYNGEPYYLIKNSWGTQFGDYGYAMLSVNNKENNCLGEFVALK
ncbi:Cathepsin L1-like protein [Aphelenchoides besseyi]|nr:Cathepsin L1-like protein [Aphelenchoides besseyi]